MRKNSFGVVFLSLIFGVGSIAKAKLVSSTTLELRGVVPEIASVSTVSLGSDLDLRPGASVRSTKIGQIQIKANSEISGIFVSSSTESGTPENMNNQPFKLSKPFTLKFSGDCRSLKSGEDIILSPEGKNVATSELTQLNLRDSSEGGVIENCDLSASWSSEGHKVYLDQKNESNHSRLYSMSIQVTLVSN